MHRPILVIQLGSKLSDHETFERLIYFCFEYAIRYLFLPGVAETVVVWFDLTKTNVTQIPLGECQNICNQLTSRYPFHLDSFWVLHDSIFIQTITPIARTFMTELQRLKIHIHRRRIPKQSMDSFFEGNAVEEKYGGTRSNVKIYYPFPFLTLDIDDDHFKHVWDVACLEGLPLVVKDLSLPINTDFVKPLISSLRDSEVHREKEELDELESLLLELYERMYRSRDEFVSRYSDVPDIPASMIEEIDTLAKNYVSGLKSMEKFSQSDEEEELEKPERRQRSGSSGSVFSLCSLPCLNKPSDPTKLTMAEFAHRESREKLGIEPG